MNHQPRGAKEAYTQPTLVTHSALREFTGGGTKQYAEKAGVEKMYEIPT